MPDQYYEEFLSSDPFRDWEICETDPADIDPVGWVEVSGVWIWVNR